MTKTTEKAKDLVETETGLDFETHQAHGFSINEAEVAQFSALAAKWWDEGGEFAPLHRFNPTRVAYIRDIVAAHLGCEAKSLRPFTGFELLDVGCGGGLLSEPMCRMGFAVTALDASAQNIGTAKSHAEACGLDISYINQTVEQLVVSHAHQFDVVLCMEVIEHVSDPKAFLQTVAQMVKPGGLLFLATLNRTLKAHALAIVGAEYILNWVPKGTHDWQKFLKPSEIIEFLEGTGLEPQTPQGVSFNPIFNKWALSDDVSVNYMIVAK